MFLGTSRRADCIYMRDGSCALSTSERLEWDSEIPAVSGRRSCLRDYAARLPVRSEPEGGLWRPTCRAAGKGCGKTYDEEVQATNRSAHEQDQSRRPALRSRQRLDLKLGASDQIARLLRFSHGAVLIDVDQAPAPFFI